MKSILLLFGLIILSQTYLAAQNYTQAVGIRGGTISGVTYRHKISELEAYEGIAHFKGNSIMLAILKEHFQPYSVDFSEFLFLMYGYGLHVGYKYTDHYSSIFGTFNYYKKLFTPIFGIDGFIGLEYRINEIPFIVSVDYKPFFEFSTRQFFNINLGDVAFSLKYRF